MTSYFLGLKGDNVIFIIGGIEIILTKEEALNISSGLLNCSVALTQLENIKSDGLKEMLDSGRITKEKYNELSILKNLNKPTLEI